jgi:hypothetical protein
MQSVRKEDQTEVAGTIFTKKDVEGEQHVSILDMQRSNKASSLGSGIACASDLQAPLFTERLNFSYIMVILLKCWDNFVLKRVCVEEAGFTWPFPISLIAKVAEDDQDKSIRLSWRDTERARLQFEDHVEHG